MGRGFPGRSARQHPNLISIQDRDTVLRRFVLGFLAVDGALCAVAAALFLPLHLGGIPFPISAVVAGAVNVLLVWAAMQWTSSTRLAGLPLWTWLATVAVLIFGGPGGDIVFGGAGIRALSPILLIVVGAGPAAWLLLGRTEPAVRGPL